MGENKALSIIPSLSLKDLYELSLTDILRAVIQLLLIILGFHYSIWSHTKEEKA